GPLELITQSENFVLEIIGVFDDLPCTLLSHMPLSVSAESHITDASDFIGGRSRVELNNPAGDWVAVIGWCDSVPLDVRVISPGDAELARRDSAPGNPLNCI